MDFQQKSDIGLEPKSLLNLYVLLQKMLNLAVALELLNSNPIQQVPKPKVERTEKPALSPAEVKDVADNMPQNLKALVVLLYPDWATNRRGEFKIYQGDSERLSGNRLIHAAEP